MVNWLARFLLSHLLLLVSLLEENDQALRRVESQRLSFKKLSSSLDNFTSTSNFDLLRTSENAKCNDSHASWHVPQLRAYVAKLSKSVRQVSRIG